MAAQSTPLSRYGISLSPHQQEAIEGCLGGGRPEMGVLEAMAVARSWARQLQTHHSCLLYDDVLIHACEQRAIDYRQFVSIAQRSARIGLRLVVDNTAQEKHEQT